MPAFSQKSLEKLSTCNSDLVRLFTEVVKHYDCSIIYGFRDKSTQNRLYKEGRSQVKFPNSMHNRYPSKGVDVQPYPINIEALNKNDLKEWGRFYNFIGLVRGIAAMLNIKIRSGSDWDGDYNLKDNQFDDLFHFEIPDQE